MGACPESEDRGGQVPLLALEESLPGTHGLDASAMNQEHIC